MLANVRASAMRYISIPAACMTAAAFLLAGCGGTKVLVSRDTTVPLELQRMSGDQLNEYFKAKSLKAYKDGSSLDTSVVMVDLAYLKATGQTMEASEEEMEALSTHRRFEVHLEYKTEIVFPGETETEGIAIDKWKITLRDSKGNELTPTSTNFDEPLVRKEATAPEPVLTEKETSKLIMTYVLKGNVIFKYQVPRGCKWVDLEFEAPQTAHTTSVRWQIKN
jgi:hypothetical protein